MLLRREVEVSFFAVRRSSRILPREDEDAVDG